MCSEFIHSRYLSEASKNNKLSRTDVFSTFAPHRFGKDCVTPAVEDGFEIPDVYPGDTRENWVEEIDSRESQVTY